MATTYYSTTDLDALVRGSFTKTTDLDALVRGSLRLPKGFVALDYTGQVGSHAPGDFIIGGTSNAIAVLIGLVDNGATGTFFFQSVTGTFQSGETLYRGSIGSELIINGDMEDDDNWISYGIDLSSFSHSQSSSRANDGSYSRYLNDSGLPTDERVGIQSDPPFVTVANNFYSVRFAVNPDYTDPFCVCMRSGANVFGHLYNYDTPSVDSWTEYQFMYRETLGGGSNARFMFLNQLGWTGTWRYYVDSVSVLEISKNASHYATADGVAYNPPIHLDALLQKPQSGSVSLDAILDLGIFIADGTLSEMQIEASFGQRIEADAKLSAMGIEARFGMRAKDPLNLSVLECEATISRPEIITIDSKLSVLGIDSRFGLRSKDDLKLSAMAIEAEISGGDRIEIDGFLAPMGIEASISTPWTISINKTLSALEPLITLSREQLISIDKKLSALAIEASIKRLEISIDSKLSALAIEATIGNRELTIDSKLSALAIEASLDTHEISVDAKLSALSIESTIGNYGIGIDSKLSALAISAAINSDADNIFNIDSKLSALSSEIVISGQYGIDIEANLSGMGIEATILAGDLISIDEKLSVMGIEATILWSNVPIVIDAMLSALVMESVGSGVGDGAVATIKETGRFDDYTLRHSR